MLTGELTNLRAIERTDAPQIHRWLDDPELMRWWGYGARAVSLGAVQRQIEQWIDDERVFEHPLAFVVESLEAESIGLMILSDLQTIDRGVEVSCFLDAAHREQGFGRDALETLREAIFTQYGLAERKDRITADLAWQDRLRADNALMARWQSLYLYYHDYYQRLKTR